MNAGIVLQGKHVRLEPLQPSHAEALAAAAAVEPTLYRWTIAPQTAAEAADYIAAALAMKDAGKALPFAIIRLEDGKVIGSTRFFDLETWPVACGQSPSWPKRS